MLQKENVKKNIGQMFWVENALVKKLLLNGLKIQAAI